MMLADQGAEVIKVENPAKGDDTRHMGPPFRGGESAFFISINRNKKSITLNLKHPEGVKLLKRLAENSDVLVENFRPGVTERLGVDYPTLREVNPRLIYCSISGFGQTGPYSNRPAYNFTVQALSGVMTMTGEPSNEPSPVGVSLGDIPAGMFAAYAISAALYARESSGSGQYIDISMLDSLVALMENPIARYGMTGKCPQPIGRYNPSITPFGVFDTADAPIVIAAGNSKLWQKLCTVLNRLDLLQDPRFTTNPLRTQNSEALHSILTDVLRKRTAREWLDLLIEQGIPVAPVNTVASVFEDPQVNAREMLIHVKQPHAGDVVVVGSPIRLSSCRGTRYAPAPQFGEHTESVLESALGITSKEIMNLKEAGAI
jgi:CoA:oxalate CoA-transferase